MFTGGGPPRNPPPLSGATSSILDALSALTSSPYEDSDPSSQSESASQEPSSQSTSSTSNPNLNPSSQTAADFINVSNQFSLNSSCEKNMMGDSNQSDSNLQPSTNPLEDLSSDETEPATTSSFTPVILSVSSSSDQVVSETPTDEQPVSINTTSSSNADTSSSSLANVSLSQERSSTSSSSPTKPKLLNRSNDIQKTVLQTNETPPETDSSTIDMIINGVKYFIGDFVYVKPPISPSNKAPLRQIVNIDRTWVTADGDQMIRCTNYFRPMETSHKPTRKFFKKEVFQTDVSTIYHLTDVIGKCYVLGMNNYFTKTLEGPEPIRESDIFVCEYRYSEKYRYFKKIAAGSLILNEQVKLIERSDPIEMLRVDASETEEEKPQINLISTQVADGSEAATKVESNNEKTFNLRSYRPVAASDKEKELRVKLKRIDEGIASEDVIFLDANVDSSNKKRKRRGSGSQKDVEEEILSTDNDSEDTDFDSDSGKDDGDNQDVGRKKKAPRNTRYSRGGNSNFRCDTCNASFEDQALLDLHAQVHLDEEDEFSSADGAGDTQWFGSGNIKKKTKHKFTTEAQYSLLNTLLIHREELIAAKTIRDKTELFKTVARELQDLQEGELTAKRCMDKWNNLLYQQKNYNRSKKGDGTRKPNFYDEIEQILNNTPVPRKKQVPVRRTFDDGEDLPSIANSAQSKVNKDGHSENVRLMRAVSPTMLSDSPIISGANSPSQSPSMSPTPAFTPVTIVTSRTADINKQMGSKDSLLLPPEPQFSPPVTELMDNNDDDVTSSSIMLPPPPQFSPPVTNERSLRDPLLAPEGILRAVPLSSLTAPTELSGVPASSNNANSIPQSSSFVPPPLIAASMLANQFTVGPLSHAVSQSLATHPNNTVAAGQGPSHSGPTLLISQSGLPNQATNQLNKMIPNTLPANKRSSTSRQSAAKSSATISSTERNLSRSSQISEGRPKTSIETMSDNVGGIFDMCKQHLQLYKEEIELRRRSTKALERQAKIQELRLKEERKHRSRFVTLMENHGRNQNKEKDLENGGV